MVGGSTGTGHRPVLWVGVVVIIRRGQRYHSVTIYLDGDTEIFYGHSLSDMPLYPGDTLSYDKLVKEGRDLMKARPFQTETVKGDIVFELDEPWIFETTDGGWVVIEEHLVSDDLMMPTAAGV